MDKVTDTVSRKSMLDAITEIDGDTNMDIYTDEVREIVKNLPPVTPTKVKIKVAYIDSDNALGYKEKEFPGYADFTMWACEESNRGHGLKIIGMSVVIGEENVKENTL